MVQAMSPFPESGRSDRRKFGEIRVRFRPEADIRVALIWEAALRKPCQILVIEFSLDRSQQLLGLLNECDMYVVQGSPCRCELFVFLFMGTPRFPV